MKCLISRKKNNQTIEKQKMTQLQISLEQLATKIDAKCVGNKDMMISGVADLEKATPSDLSFLANARYQQKMGITHAGAVIVFPDYPICEGKNYLLHENPTEAFQQILHYFTQNTRIRSGFRGIHETAVIHPSATIGADVTIAPYAVIEQNARIESGSFIGSFVYVGPFSTIGKNAVIYPHVVIRENVSLGENIIVQPGAIIGSCGYGYSTDKQGVHHKLEQIGTVQIENDVEIGANTTIDRARFEATIVRQGAKIDNLVQIAHNVEVGAHNLIVSQVGIAGSTKLGKHVVLGGKVAVNGHIRICDNVRVCACSGISKSVTSPGDYGGVPIQPLAEFNRNMVYLRRVGDLFDRVSHLEELQKKSV